jgi:dihydroorotase
MMGPHFHLRGWEQRHKDPLEHALIIVDRVGYDWISEMPNTDPALTSRDLVVRRIREAEEIISRLELKVKHSLYVGLTADPRQIEEAFQLYKELFPHVIGFKMFAGQSTGNMGIIKESEQRRVYQMLAGLGYEGVLAVHCEKEAYMNKDLWDPRNPYTHTLARLPIAEVESVRDQIRFAKEAEFKGTLHICHISVPAALELIEEARKDRDIKFKITCGLTPHHALLYDEMMKQENGLYLKMNPPLRPIEMQEAMFQAAFDGRISWFESDHAPHTLDEKLGSVLDAKGKPIYASGIPVSPFIPHFIDILRKRGMDSQMIDNLTHNNIARAYGIKVENTHRISDYHLKGEYGFSPFDVLKMI